MDRQPWPRRAFERLGHLFCGIFHRLRAVGLTVGGGRDMPVTQIEFAEATGLTSVHVNRTLQEMRGTGLIRLKGRTLDIPGPCAGTRGAVLAQLPAPRTPRRVLRD